jgi:autotransporter passenger strand-loop-strand repeat protein
VTSNATVQDGGFERIGFGGLMAGGVVSTYGDVQVSSGGLASSVTVGSRGELDVLSRGIASGTILSNGGQIEVESGGIGQATVVGSGGVETVDVGGNASGTTISSGGIDYVYGTASGATVMSGGSEYIGGALAGATLSGGFLEIKSGGTAGTSQIAFTSAGGTLQLDDSQHFSATISGFGVPGNIDLRDISFGSGTTLAYDNLGTSGTLTVSDGTHTATLNLLGQYVAGNFTKQTDNNGGTLITDPPLVGLNGSPLVFTHS